MRVLVDTCVWSAVLRRRNPDTELTARLKGLINDGRVFIIGPIRQEILSGIPDPKQFNKLKDILSAFEDIILKKEHFEKAAEFSNICRSRGDSRFYNRLFNLRCGLFGKPHNLHYR